MRNPAPRNVRAGEDKRHRSGLLIHGELAEQAACAKGFAMVRRVEDPCGVNQIVVREYVQDAADLSVQMRTGPVIGSRDIT